MPLDTQVWNNFKAAVCWQISADNSTVMFLFLSNPLTYFDTKCLEASRKYYSCSSKSFSWCNAVSRIGGLKISARRLIYLASSLSQIISPPFSEARWNHKKIRTIVLLPLFTRHFIFAPFLLPCLLAYVSNFRCMKSTTTSSNNFFEVLLCISSSDDDDDDDIVYPLSNKEKLSKNQVPLLLLFPPNYEIRGVASWGSLDALAPQEFQEKNSWMQRSKI